MISPSTPTQSSAGCQGSTDAPRWVIDRIGPASCVAQKQVGTISLGTVQCEDWRLVSARAKEAAGLGAGDFEERCSQVYSAIADDLRGSAAPHPVRFWNYLPEIHAHSGPGIDRYMNFNAGRFRALSQWLGGSAGLDRTVPSASGVGHRGRDLVVHALGSRTPGVLVANPRQIAPHRYSRRFGPLPPCFARATVVPDARGSLILVGGTASIRGEDSVHVGNLSAQIDETFHNLAHLVRAADGQPFHEELAPGDRAAALARFCNLRVYYVREQDRPEVTRAVGAAFPGDCRIEHLRADLCRAELLVEIEGVADREMMKDE